MFHIFKLKGHPMIYTGNSLSLQNHLHKTYSNSINIPTFLKSSVSSTCPSTYFTSECKMSRQWILFPRAIGKLKLTRATMLGLGIPRGGSRLAMKSDSWVKRMNCVAWGSYLHRWRTIHESIITSWSFLSQMGFCLIKQYSSILRSVYFLIKEIRPPRSGSHTNICLRNWFTSVLRLRTNVSQNYHLHVWSSGWDMRSQK